MAHLVVSVEPGARPFAACAGVGRIHKNARAVDAGSQLQHRQPVALAERQPVGVGDYRSDPISEGLRIPPRRHAVAVLASAGQRS